MLNFNNRITHYRRYSSLKNVEADLNVARIILDN